MRLQNRHAILRHAVAVDLVITALGASLLLPGGALVPLFAFTAAVVATALVAGEEAGLTATACSVISLAAFFGNVIDVTLLTGFALLGALPSLFVRVARRSGATRSDVRPMVERATPLVADLPFAMGLPLLVIVVYTDLSNIIMTRFAVPSLLQPMIVLLTVVVWAHRRRLQPAQSALHAVPLLLAAYAFVLFTTSIWATEVARADARIMEAAKAVFICVLVTTLAANWLSLRRALLALVAAAAAFSALSIVQTTTGRLVDLLGGVVAPETGHVYGQVTAGRAAGPPVSDPNFYARILLVAIPMAIALGYAEERRSRRLIYFGAALLITGGTLVTYSRGAMLAIGLMAILGALLARVRIRTVAAVTAGLLIVGTLLPTQLTARFETLEVLMPGGDAVAANDSSVEVRKLFITAGLKMFDAHPILGVGAGQFTRHYPAYASLAGSTLYSFSPAGTPAYPHGLWLEIASESGILGLAVYGALIAAALLSLLRARRRLAARGEQGHAAMATGLVVALAGYLAASVFLHETHLRYPALYFGFIAATSRLAMQHPAESSA